MCEGPRPQGRLTNVGLADGGKCFFREEVVMPGAIDEGKRDKIVMIIIAVGILITLFCTTTDGTFR